MKTEETAQKDNTSSIFFLNTNFVRGGHKSCIAPGEDATLAEGVSKFFLTVRIVRAVQLNALQINNYYGNQIKSCTLKV